MLEFEEIAWGRNLLRVAGVDEAGRGPLAGPVCAAAIIFDNPKSLLQKIPELSKVNDSKQLSESRREDLFAILTKHAGIDFSIAMSSAAEIDRVNILQATRAAMIDALEGLATPPDLALVDGKPMRDIPCPAEFIVKGDARSLSIAAASIIAKVARDRYMVALDRLHPQYGFAKHKGYGTKQHLQALRNFGPCPEHRRSFAPVSAIIDPVWDFQ